MIQTGLVGGSSASVKEHSWLLRDVHNSGYVTTGETQYLHLLDMNLSEEKWKELLHLLRLPLSCVVLDEEGRSVPTSSATLMDILSSVVKMLKTS